MTTFLEVQASYRLPTFRLLLTQALRSSRNMATVTTRAQVIIVKPGQTKHDLLNGRIPFNLFPINWKKSIGLVQPRHATGTCCHVTMRGPSFGESRMLKIVIERNEILISYGWQRFYQVPSCFLKKFKSNSTNGAQLFLDH